MSKRTRYLHLTPSDNLNRVMREGLKADADGCIFTFTDMLVANTIAREQVFTDCYSVVEIAPEGVAGRVLRDRVAEFAAQFHRVLRQSRVAPEHLSYVGTFQTIKDWPTEWDYRVNEALGTSRMQTDAFYDVGRWMRTEKAKGRPAAKVVAAANRRLRRLQGDGEVLPLRGRQRRTP